MPNPKSQQPGRPQTGGLSLSNLDHIGIVVKDIAKAVEHYESLGIGPFWSIPVTVTDRKFRGKPVDNVKTLSRKAQLGPIVIELVQPVAGQQPAMEFLNSKGEGVNHIAFRSDDIERDKAGLIAEGLEVTYEGKIVGGGGIAFFDTAKVGGISFELTQRPPV